MHNPIMKLELYPRCSKQIHNRRWLKLGSLQQLLRHNPWIRRQELLICWFLRMLSRHISSESHACAAHLGLIKFIEESI